MASIKDISGLPRDYKQVEQEEKLKRSQSSKTDKGDKATKGTSAFSGKDKVEISSAGQALSATKTGVNKYVDELRHMQTSSQEKIDEIHGKIESNFYSRPEVLEKIVESLVVLESFQSVATEGTKPEKGLTDEQLQHIRVKIQNGDYNSSNVLETIVSELMKIM